MHSWRITSSPGKKHRPKAPRNFWKVNRPASFSVTSPITFPRRNVTTLTSASWPQDYCVDMELTFPKFANKSPYGSEGGVALMGNLYISVVHTKKLFQGAGKGFGLMVSEQGNGDGAYYVTTGFAQPGSTHNALFCYRQTTNKPTWLIDGEKIDQGYLRNEGAKLPATRDVELTFFSGSQTDYNAERLWGATLHSWAITPLIVNPEGVAPTITVAVSKKNMPITSSRLNVATLSTAMWPEDYCVNFDLTFPKKRNKDPNGYEGAVALMGNIYLAVTHTKKLIGGEGPITAHGDRNTFGLAAFERSSGDGPWTVHYVTAAFARPGTTHKARFCYRKSVNEPSWKIDGKNIKQGYLYNKGVAFPSTRDVKLSFFGNDDKGTSNDKVGSLKGASLGSFQITTAPGGKYSKKKASLAQLTTSKPYVLRFHMTLSRCFTHCSKTKGLRYFAVTSGDTCVCSEFPPGLASGSNLCDVQCSGKPGEYCGGLGNYASVYNMFDCLPPGPEEKKQDQKKKIFFKILFLFVETHRFG